MPPSHSGNTVLTPGTAQPYAPGTELGKRFPGEPTACREPAGHPETPGPGKVTSGQLRGTSGPPFSSTGIQSSFVRCFSRMLQASSVSASILKGEPPILTALPPPIARRHDAT